MSGISLNLTKDNSLKKIEIGLGWDMIDGYKPIDLDAIAVLSSNRRVKRVVYWGDMEFKGIYLNQDDRTGNNRKDEDNECINVDFNKLPQQIDRISVLVNIYNPKTRLGFFKIEKENFGMVENSYMRIVNKETKEELCRYNLEEAGKGYTAFHVADLIRVGDNWSVKAIGEPTNGDVGELSRYIENKL